MRLLVRKGADVLAPDDLGRTALHWAVVRNGHTGTAVMLVLLECGADVHLKSDDGRTPLHDAAYRGQATAVQLFLDAGADLQSTTTDGSTPEDLATARGHLQTAAMLAAETVRRAACQAFALGHQERLGAGSRVRWLDAGLVRMVLEQV